MTTLEIETEREAARRQLAGAGITLSPDDEIEIADLGLGRYRREGLALVTRINEPEYCSKWLVLLPGQTCPTHYHKLKKETFFAIQGDVTLWIEGQEIALTAGLSHTIPVGARHRFWSNGGAVIEEVSTHDEDSDSYFDDPAIVR